MSINLIPPQLKKERQLQHQLSRIYRRVFLLFILLLGLTGLLLFGNVSLRTQTNELKTKVNATNAEIANYTETESKINLINEKLGKLEGARKNQVIWSSILAELARSTPQQVVIRSLSVDQNTNTITLAGDAETRREIAIFKEKLESSTYFKNVFFSSSTLNENNQNYTFAINAELEKNK